MSNSSTVLSAVLIISAVHAVLIAAFIAVSAILDHVFLAFCYLSIVLNIENHLNGFASFLEIPDLNILEIGLRE